MKKLIALLMSVFALAALPAAVQAQTTSTAPATAAEETPSGRMPAALVDMLMASYKCQALTTAEFYGDAKKTVTDITMKLSGDDATLTNEFMKAIEDLAKAQCPDPSTCWREYLGVDATVTAEAATPMCEQKIMDSMGVVSGILDEIIKEQG